MQIKVYGILIRQYSSVMGVEYTNEYRCMQLVLISWYGWL